MGHGTGNHLTRDKCENGQASSDWKHFDVVREEDLDCKVSGWMF